MKLYVLILILFVPLSFSQEKYFIYFNDKGPAENQSLNKGSALYTEALRLLSDKAVERRKKVMGEDNIITYEDLQVNPEYVSALESLNIIPVHKLTWFNAVSAYLNKSQLQEIEKLPFIKNIEPVKSLKYKSEETGQSNIHKSSGTNTDINYGFSYNQLELSDIPAVHSRGITGEGIIVGLLDSGFDWQTHESLRDATVIDEYDFVFNDDVTSNQSQDSFNQHNHGTLVFSVIGGYKDSSIVGAAFGADFLLAKTEYIVTETNVEEDNYAAALIWMESRGVDITSSSLGYNDFDAGQQSYSYSDMNGNTAIVTKAAEAAFQRGVITVTSAGNEGNVAWRHITAPADGFNIISVGAVNNNNELAGFSSRGPSSDGRIKPEVVAQGVAVYGATASSAKFYGTANGTSLSAPIASGVAALLLSAYPHLTNVQVRKILLETSDNAVNPDNDRGYGLISAVKAISYPNLEKIGESFRLHKAFLNSSNINPGTVMLHYSSDGINYVEAFLNFDGNYKFGYDLPFMQNDNGVNFYFTYSDSSGNSFRDPQLNSYRFEYGKTDIVLNVEDNPIPEDYILSQNYPNPFNNQTKINFIASRNEKAEIIIIDAVGQRIKNLFNGIANNGLNTVLWDGSTENGLTASSGVYYYILKLNGKEYGRKMVFLK